MFKMFKIKPKKVFEKINKMDRKQAYTLGAIILVAVVALLMLVSTLGSEDPFDKDMKARGYDLANMPFATDAAEQYLLANAYPDMQENGSTLLYSAQDKEARQEADAQAAEEEFAQEEQGEAGSGTDETASAASSSNSSGGRGRGYSGGGGGGGKTQINQLGSANRPSSGGSSFGATYGPTGDFRQLKSQENKGNEAPATLNTGNARKALSQFHSGTLAARKYKENQMTGARKALMGGNVAGSGDGNAVGIGGGGLTIDPTAPPHSTDLAPIEKKVSDMADPEDKKDDEDDKLSFWEQLGQDLIREAATRIVSSIAEGVGDTVKGAITGKQAQYAARKQANTEIYNAVHSGMSAEAAQAKYGISEEQYRMYAEASSPKQTYKYSYTLKDGTKVDGGKRAGYTNQAGDDAWAEARAKAAEDAAKRRQAEAEERAWKAKYQTTQQSTGTASGTN